MIKTAKISDCSHYRYFLTRIWCQESGLVNFIMLNPSTADAEKDDPTIRRCMGFARSWGYGGIAVTNLFAYRTTSPKTLKEAFWTHGLHGPKHPYNADTLVSMAKRSAVVICAWGNHGEFEDAGHNTRSMLKGSGIKPHYLRLTKSGEPAHPLYLPKNLEPIPWK